MQLMRVRACSNDEFREAVLRQEGDDVRRLGDRLQRSLDEGEARHCGVSRLRSFLEGVLRARYLDSVPHILPLLDKEYRTVVRARAAPACSERPFPAALHACAHVPCLPVPPAVAPLECVRWCTHACHVCMFVPLPAIIRALRAGSAAAQGGGGQRRSQPQQP
jgi:hypothetical protein